MIHFKNTDTNTTNTDYNTDDGGYETGDGYDTDCKFEMDTEYHERPNNFNQLHTRPNLVYQEIINLTKLKHIINNPKLYKKQIEAEDKLMRRWNKRHHKKAVCPFKLLAKIRDRCFVPAEFEGTEYAVLKVNYNKGRTSNNIGRWYSKDGIGLQPLIGCVRHTICDGIWTDIDQVNSHPTLLKILFDKYGCNSTMLDECVNNRNQFLSKISKNRDEAKTNLIAVINGSGIKNNLVLNEFNNNIKDGINLITNHPDFDYITEYVKKAYPNEKNINGKIISRILQVKENELLQSYLEWAYGKKYIDYKTNNVSLIFDGFQLLSKFNITDEDLQECRKYALMKTGYDVELKVKPFDNKLPLPIDYYNIDEYKESLYKFLKVANEFVNNSENNKDIHDAITSNGSHHKLAKISKLIFGDWIYYDGVCKKWFYYDAFNVWCETDNIDNFKTLNQEVLERIFSIKRNEYRERLDKLEEQKKLIEADKKARIANLTAELKSINPSKKKKPKDDEIVITIPPPNDDKNDDKNDDEIKINEPPIDTNEPIEKVLSNLEDTIKTLKSINCIILEIQNITFISKVLENARSFFKKDNFYNTCIDSKAYLFSFSNKLYDFTTNTLRPIRPDDYIMTNTGYKYPENIKEDNIKFVENYLKQLFPDEEMYNYILDTCGKTLNGEKTEQSFNIHTGSGSNGKTSFSGVFEKALGNYAVNISAETFTRPKQGANDTGELYKAKGKRGAFINELEENDKLQTGMLKLCADAGNRTLIVRELYKNSIEIKITFQLNFFCNEKPDLSSCDGGIGRRVRVVEWDRKFKEKDKINPNNPNEIVCDPEMINKLITDDIRDAFIKILLDRWGNRLCNVSRISVPKKIITASADYINDSNPILGFLEEYYDFTNNDDDKVKTAHLLTAYNSKNRGNDISAKKLKSSIGVIGRGVKFIKEKGCVYYQGLKEKKEDDDDTDDE